MAEKLLNPYFLDYIFPFVVLFYGAMMTFVLNIPKLVELSEKRLPEKMHNQVQSHRTLGALCLFVGGLWSLQNIWHY